MYEQTEIVYNIYINSSIKILINIKTCIDSMDYINILRKMKILDCDRKWNNPTTHFLKDCFPGLPVALIRIVWNLLYPNEQSYLLRASRPVRRCFYLTSHTQGKREEYSISWKTGRGFMNAQRHTNCMIWEEKMGVGQKENGKEGKEGKKRKRRKERKKKNAHRGVFSAIQHLKLCTML